MNYVYAEQAAPGIKPTVREHVLAYGIDTVTDHDLVMLLLGTGTKGVPVRRLAGRVLKIMRCCAPENYLEELMEIDGMGPGKAALIAAALELGRRFHSHTGICIKKPQDIIPLVQHYTLEMQEHFICASLNGAHEIVKLKVISVGTLDRTIIHPREIFSDAFKFRAAAVILCHNHPSGSIQPSSCDVESTERLVSASHILGIRVLDHIIIGQQGYYSFAENGFRFISDE